ncbi:hypothetical protein LRS71_05925 [Rhodococcus pyridinivorans]|uniref:hypothetical protein n=1 Tax=Rhodococcus pyridinivorans TaxID=103816 RepID=UPI001E5BFCF7|nr:hypothetical protein [Rhodococcus pyridinivorans]MCD5419099.1 hypothetical protein [Rhodococcus pyridinivorans]
MSTDDLEYMDGIGWEEFHRRSRQGLPYPTRAEVHVRPARTVLPTRPVVVQDGDKDLLEELAVVRSVAQRILAELKARPQEWVRRRELVGMFAPKRGYRVSAAALWLEEHGYIELQKYKKAGKGTFRVRLR